jgi:hypothetical protein
VSPCRCSEAPVDDAIAQDQRRLPRGFDAVLPGRAAAIRQTLTDTAGIIRRHHKQIGSPWRRLAPGQQALLVLAYLRKGETFADLAAGFGIGTATADGSSVSTAGAR